MSTPFFWGGFKIFEDEEKNVITFARALLLLLYYQLSFDHFTSTIDLSIHD